MTVWAVFCLLLYSEKGEFMGKIISVASGKGGTGKSTVCVTLGMALVKRGHSVLLIDCDSGMRGLDIMMGISKSLVFDIADAVCGNCSPEQIIYPCNHISGLSLIPAPQNAEDELSPAILKQFTDNVRSSFDYIIIDSPAGVGKGFDTAVMPADLCLVIANTEPTSLRGCVNVRKKLTDMGKDNIRLIINRFSRTSFRELAFYPDLDCIIDESGIQLIGIITEDRQVVASIQKGLAYRKKCTALEGIDRIAARLDGENVPLLIY